MSIYRDCCLHIEQRYMKPQMSRHSSYYMVEMPGYPLSPYLVDCDDYKVELMDSLSEAWRVAKQNIASSQNRQKTQHDNRATKEVDMHVGDRVMVYMPHETTGKQRKLARPYFGHGIAS